MNEEPKALIGRGESKIISNDETGIKIWNGDFVEKYKDRSEYLETKWQLQKMTDAFLSVAIDDLAREKAEKKKESEQPFHKKPTPDPQQ